MRDLTGGFLGTRVGFFAKKSDLTFTDFQRARKKDFQSHFFSTLKSSEFA